MTSKRIVTTYPDGTLKIQVVDTRTHTEKLPGLSFADKLELLYPTIGKDVTEDWVDFDDHKRVK